MDEQNSGNSPASPVNVGGSEVAAAFGFKSEPEATQSESKSAPVAEETKTVEQAKPEQAQSEEQQATTVVGEKTDPLRELSRKADDAHSMVVDLLEEKFQQLSNGDITNAELKEWFDSHPDFGEIANRSKRKMDGGSLLKEKYRALLSEKVEANDDSDEEEKSSKSSTPSLNDINKLLDERDARLLQKTVRAERERLSEKFAVSKGIKDEAYTKLTSIADSLLKVNEDWDYPEALEAAHRAMLPSKGQPVNLDTANRAKIEQEKQASQKGLDSLDFQPLISMDDFAGRKK